jgi:hypothetical protein
MLDRHTAIKSEKVSSMSVYPDLNEKTQNAG